MPRGAASFPACLLAALASMAAADIAPARGQTCLQAAAIAETEQQLPAGVLQAIARAETGRPDPLSGALTPWPWAIDVAGQDAFFADAGSAAQATEAWLARGVASIDVGCLQVNLRDHPLAFASLAEAFQPLANARYAGRFLAQLHAEFADWPRAIAAYHSRTPALGEPYAARVLALWTGAPADAAAPPPAAVPHAAWSAPLAVTWQPASATTDRLLAAMESCDLPAAAPGTLRAAWRPRPCARSPFGSAAALRRALAGDPSPTPTQGASP